MIECLSLTNFQSHKDSSLDFSPGVNLIIGPSDSGKTAVIRALNWVVNNRPAGDSFRSKFSTKKTDQTEVVLFTQESKIKRVKSDKENYYEIDGQQYKAMGQAVPDNIISALNFSGINIQYQMDSPFLLSETSGEVARYFNKIVNLEKIDASLKQADSNIRKVNSQIKFNEQELEKQQQELDSYSWISSAEKDFAELELLETKERQCRSQYSGLAKIIEEIKNFVNLRSSISYNKAEKDIEKLFVLQNTVQNKTKEKQSLHILLTDINRYQDLLNGVDYTGAEKELKNIIKIDGGFDKQYQQAEILSNIIDEIKQHRKQMITITTKIKTIEDDLSEIMPDVCPLCGQEIKK